MNFSKNQKTTVRGLIFVLAVILAFGMFLFTTETSPASAETMRDAGTYQQVASAISSAADGDTIRLTADINFDTSNVTISSKNLTLDLNGKKITYSGTDNAGNGAIIVTGSSEFNLKDGVGGGEIIATGKNGCGVFSNPKALDSGIVNIYSGTLRSTTGGGLYSGGKATINIYDGANFIAEGTSNCIYSYGAVSNQSHINIFGGTFTASGNIETGGFVVYNAGTNPIAISGNPTFNVSNKRGELSCDQVPFVDDGYTGSKVITIQWRGEESLSIGTIAIVTNGKDNLGKWKVSNADRKLQVGTDGYANDLVLADSNAPAPGPENGATGENGSTGGNVAGIVFGVIFGLIFFFLLVFIVLYVLWKNSIIKGEIFDKLLRWFDPIAVKVCKLINKNEVLFTVLGTKEEQEEQKKLAELEAQQQGEVKQQEEAQTAKDDAAAQNEQEVKPVKKAKQKKVADDEKKEEAPEEK